MHIILVLGSKFFLNKIKISSLKFFQASSPFGSSEVLSVAADTKMDSRSLQEEHMVAALGKPRHFLIRSRKNPKYSRCYRVCACESERTCATRVRIEFALCFIS